MREGRQVRDQLVHKQSVQLGERTYDCCKDERNMVPVQDKDDIIAGRLVSVCRRCTRRHIRVRTNPWKLMGEWGGVGVRLAAPETARRLGL